MNFLRYRQPYRGWIVKLSRKIWQPNEAPEWFLAWLFPDDMMITFQESSVWTEEEKHG